MRIGVQGIGQGLVGSLVGSPRRFLDSCVRGSSVARLHCKCPKRVANETLNRLYVCESILVKQFVLAWGCGYAYSMRIDAHRFTTCWLWVPCFICSFMCFRKLCFGCICANILDLVNGWRRAGDRQRWGWGGRATQGPGGLRSTVAPTLHFVSK